MCGRFTLDLLDLSELKTELGVQRVLIADWHPRYNIAPSQLVPVVLMRGERVLAPLRWGLRAPFTPSAARAKPLINARVESIAQRPSFRGAFRERRCIVPATGYFEWRAVPGSRKKQPFWIRPRDTRLMALAALWEANIPSEGQSDESFAIVTTEAEGAVREIHSRMPLELRGADIDTWLQQGVLAKRELEAIVATAKDVAHLELREVDRRVSSPAFDDPGCIAPPAGPANSERQLGLFK